MTIALGVDILLVGIVLGGVTASWLTNRLLPIHWNRVYRWDIQRVATLLANLEAWEEVREELVDMQKCSASGSKHADEAGEFEDHLHLMTKANELKRIINMMPAALKETPQ